MTRYQAFRRYPALPSMWHSISGAVNSIDVAIDWILHDLRWVELQVRGGTPLENSEGRHMSPVRVIADAAQLEAGILSIPEDRDAWPAHLDHLPRQHVVRTLRLVRAPVPAGAQWRWNIGDL